MKVLYILGAVVAFVVIFASSVNHIVSVPDSKESLAVYSDSEESYWLSYDWVEQFKKVSAYYTPPKPQKKRPPKREPKVKKTIITDARLIGIIDNENPQAMLVIPGQGKITYMNVGDSWLEPWVLEAIHVDHVTWKNTEQGSASTQKLF